MENLFGGDGVVDFLELVLIGSAQVFHLCRRFGVGFLLPLDGQLELPDLLVVFGAQSDPFLLQLRFHGRLAVQLGAAASLLLLHHFAQPLNLLLIFPQHGVLGILIDPRTILNIFGPIGVPQSAEGLVVVVVGRRHAGDHERLGIASQGVLNFTFLINELYKEESL